jgi:hypothetical protein
MSTGVRAQIHDTLFGIYLRRISIALVIVIVSTLSVKVSTPARATSPLTTCVDLKTLKERISRSGNCRTSQEAVAKWRLASSDSALSGDKSVKYLKVCSNKASSPVSYQLIRTKCARHQQESIYNRSAAIPATPVITGVISLSHESVSLALASGPAITADSPVAQYTIFSSKGDVVKVHTWTDLTLTISGLTSSTSYTFTVSATNADGTSTLSAVSLPVTTQVFIPPTPPASRPSAPNISLSSSAETLTANISTLSGYTITSTGGAIANYSISPAAPAGLTFSTVTGLLSGTPTTPQNLTAYTITATNEAGSATAIFRLKVTDGVGDIGPGGGIIFYVSSNGFACGPTLNLVCTYLEAAPTDGPSSWIEPARAWSGNIDDAVGSTSDAIGTGYKNTLAMIAQNSTIGKAGTATRAFRGPYNLSDWYLPSIDELTEMYSQRTVIGDFDLSNLYWSSSEISGYSAKGVYFVNGATLDATKGISYSLRPIRAGVTRTTPTFTLSSTSETLTARTSALSGYTISSSGGTISNFTISPSVPAGLTFNASTGLLSGTPTETITATTYTITGTNRFGSNTATFRLRVTGDVGDIGPGGGIIFYISAAPFTSSGSTCDTSCRYLEVAPATWQSAGVSVANDGTYQWSNNKTGATEQNTSTVGTESGFDQEKFNWKIGQGFYNTSVMKVAGATSSAQAAVLAYAGNSIAGQWFIPSANELNELCKYARGQLTGNVTVACDSSGTLKTGTLNDFGGFVSNLYMSSSEWWNYGARSQYFNSGSQRSGDKDLSIYVRPIRAF